MTTSYIVQSGGGVVLSCFGPFPFLIVSAWVVLAHYLSEVGPAGPILVGHFSLIFLNFKIFFKRTLISKPW